jgi:hypothetical protein
VSVSLDCCIANLNHLLSSQRLIFLQTLEVTLSNSHPVHDVLLLNRLARAILPSLSTVLAVRSEVTSDSGNLGFVKKKDRKRLRGYEGAELFNPSREAICRTIEEGDVVLTALNGLFSYLGSLPISDQSCSCSDSPPSSGPLSSDVFARIPRHSFDALCSPADVASLPFS